MVYKHISKATEEFLSYADGRRKGLIKPLQTNKPKLNKAIDGFSWGRIYTFASLSGGGKSVTVEEIKRDFCDLNKAEEFDILSFEFEMLAVDQIARNVSGKTSKTVAELYSANDTPLSDETFKEITETVKDITIYPIYYVDTVGSVKSVRETILTFINDNNLKERNRGLIITIDHILLLMGRQGQSEKEVIDECMQMCVELKTTLTAQGVKIMFIILSQLNRDIERLDRVMNPSLHYPGRNDLFAASSIYYCSDVVIIFHKPTVIEGMGQFYGPPRTGYPKGLPTKTEDEKNFIYWHIIKSRFATNQILIMVDDFAHSRVLEYVEKK